MRIKFQDHTREKGAFLMLEKERKLQIESEVSKILTNYDFEKNPYVDITAIVKKDGFTITPQEMELETTGCLFVEENNGKESNKHILVNTIFKNPDNDEDVVFKKSRFITAHEYGHFVLHHSFRAHRDTYHRTEPLELEADYFARSILMPLDYFSECYKLLQEFIGNDTKYIIELLSKLFRVTKNKVAKRINDIKELAPQN